MKQFLFVTAPIKSTGKYTTINAAKANPNMLAFFDPTTDTFVAEMPTKHNFGILLTRPNNQMPLIIPEVDVKSLIVLKSDGQDGGYYVCSFTMPTPVVGKEYTLRFVKKGAVPHQRNTWTVSIVAKTTTPATEAARFVKAIIDKLSNEFSFTVSNSGASIEISCNTKNEDWNVIPLDELSNVELTQSYTPSNLDYAYVKDLASKCAAGKGFNNTDYQGREFLPGYPEEITNEGPNTLYSMYTLRFAVPRVSAKTRDEVVNQIVHIVWPQDNENVETALETFFAPYFSDGSNSDNGGNGGQGRL